MNFKNKMSDPDSPVITLKLNFDDVNLFPEVVMCLYAMCALIVNVIVYMNYIFLTDIFRKSSNKKSGYRTIEETN